MPSDNNSLDRSNGVIRRRTFLKASGIGSVAGTGLIAGCLSEGDEADVDPDDSDVDDPDVDDPDEDDPVVIGALEPLSGPFAAWGGAHLSGLEFAVDEINQDGGVLDRNVEIVHADTESDPGEGDTLFRRFVEEEGAAAITGPVSSDLGIRTAITAEELEVPQYLNMAGSHDIIDKDSRYSFRVGLVPAPTGVRAVAELAEDRGFESVGAIIADYAWGRAVEDSIEEFFPDDIDHHIEVAPLGETDFTTFIREIPDDIDMMIAMGHPPGSNGIASQMAELGVTPEITTGGYLPPEVQVSAQGQDVIETVNTTHLHLTDVTSDEYIDLATRYYEETGEHMTTYGAYGYVTGRMIGEAIEDAGSADPTAIADATREIEFDTIYVNPIQYTEWGELQDQVHLFSQFEFEAPDYYPEGEWRIEEVFRSSSLPAYDPEEFPL